MFDADGRREDWYCDIARPDVVADGWVVSEDLELDLWVSADRAVIVRLDEEETDFTPEVTAAIAALERLAHAGDWPFKDRRVVFGEDPELYDRMRPSYPAALVDDLVALVGAAAKALDIGCGTGKATALLAARGMTGVAVDPDPGWPRSPAAGLAAYPAWRVDGSELEGWSPSAGDAPFDLAASAQAWHWLDPHVRLDKALSLLRPGGWLALFWNRPAEDDSALRHDLDRVYAALAPEFGASPQARREQPSGTKDVHRWSHTYTADEWVELARTHSDHRMLPADRREALLSAAYETIEAHGGTYAHPYDCALWRLQA